VNKIDREKQFHNRAFTENTRNTSTKFYSITQCSRNFYLNFLKNNCSGKNALEYGCGPGSSAIFLAKNGAFVTGVDISENAIALAGENAKKYGIEIDFKVTNAEDMELADNSFQLVCGSGIIHHLDLDKAYSELTRVLTPDGSAIFLEPLGHNALINWYRRRTPHLRTPDEHPLLMNDLLYCQRYFREVEFTYFHLFSLAAVPVRNFSFFPHLLSFLDKFDSTVFKFLPFSQKFSWTVAITLRNPFK
jgi:ubiquinone/menaquinone biosynthesis C-methylase UbiE